MIILHKIQYTYIQTQPPLFKVRLSCTGKVNEVVLIIIGFIDLGHMINTNSKVNCFYHTFYHTLSKGLYLNILLS